MLRCSLLKSCVSFWGPKTRDEEGNDLLYLADFGRSFSRASLNRTLGVGKTTVVLQKGGVGEGDERYQVYIEMERDGRYGTTGNYSAAEADRLVVCTSRAVAEFCGSTVDTDADYDEDGQEVELSAVRMVTFPGVIGTSIAVDDVLHIVWLSLRYDGNKAFIDIRWSAARNLISSSMRIRDFKHDGGTEYDPAQCELAESVFAKVAEIVNGIQVASGLRSLVKVNPVADS